MKQDFEFEKRILEELVAKELLSGEEMMQILKVYKELLDVKGDSDYECA